MDKAPQGRAYALELPQSLTGKPFEFLEVGGICYVYQPHTRLLFNLEAVCTKVEIPGVKYRDNS